MIIIYTIALYIMILVLIDLDLDSRSLQCKRAKTSATIIFQ